MRARWLLLAAALVAVPTSVPAADRPAVDADAPTKIGSRLELFVDDALVERIEGDARLVLHRPVAREVVLSTDAPWEGNAAGYQSVFRDGQRCRMYYRGLHYAHGGKAAAAKSPHPAVLCYAESDDGLAWRKPNLGLIEYGGSQENNIVLDPAAVAEIGGDPAHTAVFLDANPACPADARYKIVILGSKPTGLYLLQSGDGLRFRLASRRPVVTEGAFDSQNVIFWDPQWQLYREYHRGFREGVRDIFTATSADCLRFPPPRWLEYSGAPTQQLYTNQVQPYYRAPHLLVGFPMRYTDRGWFDPLFDLPGQQDRIARGGFAHRYATAVTDAVFMSSRDGARFHRRDESFIRPGPSRSGSWVYGDNFVFWGMVPTPSHLIDAPEELSLYVVENYWQGTACRFRRHTLRVDGFVSLSATAKAGTLLTRPLVFDGGCLTINAETSGAGGLQVELQDAGGTPLAGYALADCPEIRIDSLRHVVRWKGGGDVRPLAGKPLRIKFALRDADLYAFQFVPYEPDPRRPMIPKPKTPRG